MKNKVLIYQSIMLPDFSVKSLLYCIGIFNVLLRLFPHVKYWTVFA